LKIKLNLQNIRHQHRLIAQRKAFLGDLDLASSTLYIE
jgi:hypothetical protein